MNSDPNRELTAFGPDGYESLLSALLARGYRAVPLTEIHAECRHLFLRHDVDLCPDRALQIARREAALGVKATYYFLVSTQIYSVAAAENRQILHEIATLGHEVGLHFDAEQYSGQAGALDEFAQRECEILELCSGQPVQSISFHRPAPQYLNRPEPIAGRRHCYEPALFTEIAYISDSNGGWHHGHPLDHSAVAEGRAIQLLTHPIWWCNDVPQLSVETMNKFFDNRSEALRAALAGTVTAYRKALEDQGE